MYVVVEEGGGADAEEAPLPHLEAPKPLLPQIAVEVQLEKQLARGVLGHLLDVLGTQGQDVPPVDDHLLEGGDVVRGVLEAKVVKEGALQRGDKRVHPLVPDDGPRRFDEGGGRSRQAIHHDGTTIVSNRNFSQSGFLVV